MANIDLKDLLYYVDDILTLCSNQDQLKKAVKAVEEWSDQNGMLLNKKK